MMTLENGVKGMEYSEHLTQWKAAFQQFYGTHSSHHRETVQADVAQNGGSAVSETVSDGSGNPYAAVLTGLQTLLEGPLFKGQQPEQDAVKAGADSTPDAAEQEEADEDEEEEPVGDEQETEETEVPAAAAGVSPAARSPPGSRRPRKRQAAASPQGDDQDSPEAATAAAAAVLTGSSGGRPPATKRRRNTQASNAVPNPPPASASLNDLATLAAAVAEEEEGDQHMEQDQGMLAAYASGSLGGALSAQPETGGTSARGARGGSRGRQRTPAPSSSGADEGDSLGMSFPLVNEDGKPLTKQQIKRLRRQQSNRESARRSRQRKAEEANMLARRVGDLEVTCGTMQAKNATLLAEVQQLRGIIDMMASDSSALAAQVAELGGTVPAEIMTNVTWLAQLRAANLAAAGVQAGTDNAAA